MRAAASRSCVAVPAKAALIGPSLTCMRPLRLPPSVSSSTAPGRQPATLAASPNSVQTSSGGRSTTKLSASRVQPGSNPLSPVAARVGAADDIVAADQHARRAEAALQRVFCAERLAQPHHHGVVGETLDRPYIGAVAAHGEGQAGARRGAVEEDGAGAADALLTAEMGTGQ